MYEWDLEVNYIKRIEFADVPVGDGAGGTEITMAFRERYYGKFDTFKIEKTGQHCFCLTNPVRKGDCYWEQTVRLVSTNYDTILDVSGCQPGDTTRWISNYHPELHDEGLIYVALILVSSIFYNEAKRKIFLIAGTLSFIKICQSAAKSKIIQAQREVLRNVHRLVQTDVGEVNSETE